MTAEEDEFLARRRLRNRGASPHDKQRAMVARERERDRAHVQPPSYTQITGADDPRAEPEPQDAASEPQDGTEGDGGASGDQGTDGSQGEAQEAAQGEQQNS